MSDWTDDRIEILKTLWQGGLSAAQVAQALGGVTRNAVIGKVHRLGLATRAGVVRAIRPRLLAAPRPRAAALCKPIVAVVEPDPLRLEDGGFATMRTIEKAMCRWPIGDPAAGAFHFCGCAAKQSSPYCDAHAQRAHQPHRMRAARPQIRRFANSGLWG